MMNNKKKKNIALGLALFSLVVIFYVVTIIKM